MITLWKPDVTHRVRVHTKREEAALEVHGAGNFELPNLLIVFGSSGLIQTLEQLEIYKSVRNHIDIFALSNSNELIELVGLLSSANGYGRMTLLVDVDYYRVELMGILNRLNALYLGSPILSAYLMFKEADEDVISGAIKYNMVEGCIHHPYTLENILAVTGLNK